MLLLLFLLFLSSSSNVMVFGQSDEESIYLIETVYADVLRTTQEALNQLQLRVSAGRTLVQFPDRIKALLSTSLSEFHRQVAHTETVRERTERAGMIRSFVLSGASLLFEQQVLLKEFDTVKRLKSDLSRLYAPSSDVDSEALQALARQTVFDHKLSIGELEDDDIECRQSESKLSEFSAKVDDIIKEFSDSPEVKLLELKLLDKQVKSNPKNKKSKEKGGKGKRKLLDIVRVGVSVVGMLRPHGFGNLQGVLSYATSMLGIPVDFLLGVQNDGDSLEVSVR
jgi:hypothetical protein